MRTPDRTAPGARIGRSVSYQVVAQIIALTASLAVVPVLTRYLGVAGYGVFVTVTTFTSLASSLADLGIGATSVREIAANRLADGPGIGTGALVRAAAASLATALAALAAARMGQPAAVVGGLAIALGNVLATSIAAVGPNVVFQVRERFAWLIAAAAVQASLWIGGALAVARLNLGVDGALTALGLASAGGLVASTLAARRYLASPLAVDRRVARALLTQGAPLGLASVLALAYYRVDTIVLSALAGSAAVGLYGAAYRFLDQARAVAGYIGVASHPALARESADPGAFRARFEQSARWAVTAGAVAAAGLFVGADQLTAVLLGARFGGSGSLLRILAAAVAPMFLNAVIPYAMIARRRPAAYIWINLAALVLNVGANLILIPVYGPIACAWLTVLTELFVLTLSLAAIRRTLGYLPSTSPPIRAVAAAIVSILADLALRRIGVVPAHLGFAIVLGALLIWFRLVPPARVRGAFRGAHSLGGAWP